MFFRRFFSLITVLSVCFSTFVFITEPVSATEYDFTERIVYGGAALDVGDYIYYGDSNDGMKLYRRLAGSDEAELIYSAPVGYLNLFNEQLYFISDNRIISIDFMGKNEQIIYDSDTDITHLYVTDKCLYYLCERKVYKYKNGNIKTVFTAEGMCAFIPIKEDEFRWYAENPQYEEIDQAGDEIYEETKEKYLIYTYEAKTNESIAYIADTYKSTVTLSGGGYSGPFVDIGETTLPLAEYMPGTFFSKNGKACTCHDDPHINCISSVGGCNCMRYWPTGIAATCEVDLLGAQCFAFARFVFYKCFGFIDHPINATRYYDVGELPKAAVTVNSVKELMMKAAPGAHVRLNRGHSISILLMDDDFLYIYHGNAGGDGVATQPCVVSTRRYTWSEFAAYAVAGISYINMPYDYPGDTIIVPINKSIGYYKITEVSNALNVRSGAGTTFAVLGTLKKDDYASVLEVSGTWGRINYNNSVGWISLDYATFYTLSNITPSENSPLYFDNTGELLLGASERLDFYEFTDSFSKQSLTAYDKYGNDLTAGGYIGTGSVIKIEVDGVVPDSKTVVIKGDANGNGIVDVGDYLILKRIFCGSYSPDDIYLLAADIDGDGVIDSKDCFALKRYLIGIDEKLK